MKKHSAIVVRDNSTLEFSSSLEKTKESSREIDKRLYDKYSEL